MARAVLFDDARGSLASFQDINAAAGIRFR
jgi:hypothetical protein